MPNKNNIFSKEELFKLIDEKKSLPPDADDFDKEALEGLSMLTNRKKLDEVDRSIDEVLRAEVTRAKKRRNLYLFSAAASVILIIGLFFLFKENSFDKKAETLAENTQAVPENTKQEAPVISDEKIPAEKKSDETTVTTGSSFGAGKAAEQKPETVVTSNTNGEGQGGGDAAPVPDQAIAEVQTKTENRKALNEESEKEADDRAQGGKDYKAAMSKSREVKKEEAANAEIKTEDKEKEKTRFETNTVWTSPSASGAGIAASDARNKRASDDNSNKNQDADESGKLANNNSVSAQKNLEMSAAQKQKANDESKKMKSANAQPAKLDTVVADMLAGYAYYDQKADKGLVQGGPPQKAAQMQSEAAPVTTQADVPAEPKLAQGTSSEKKTGKHNAQTERAIADLQTIAPPQTAARGNTNEQQAEFVGGTEAMQQYVKQNLKISEPNKSGTIVAEFDVEPDGKVDEKTVKITTKIKDCNPCSEDVKELVKTMPKLKPATENKKPARSRQKLSVQYNADKAAK